MRLYERLKRRLGNRPQLIKNAGFPLQREMHGSASVDQLLEGFGYFKSFNKS